jgi:hypothetical protein
MGLKFIQDWGTYDNQTMVLVGYNLDQIIVAVEKAKWDRMTIILKSQKNDPGSWFNKSTSGLSWVCGTKSLLMFKDWKNDTKHLGCFTHELYHLIFQHMHKQRTMAMENEACAYQISYLFRNIKDKLNGT